MQGQVCSCSSLFAMGAYDTASSAVPYEAFVPEHTRYALFQLYCDLRANPPRDRHWFVIHARRLQPHTFSGWIVRPAHSTLCDCMVLPASI